MWRNKFVRRSAVFAGGSALSNVIQALAGVLLARILQPELFGVYALSFGLASMLVVAGIPDVISTLAAAAYARKDENELRGTFRFLLKASIFTGLISVAFIGLLGPFIADRFYGDSRIGLYAVLFIFAVFISNTLFSPLKVALQVSERINALTRATVYDQLVRNSAVITLSAAGFGVLGAVTGHVLGAGAMFAVSAFMWHRLSSREPIFPNLGELLRGWRFEPFQKRLRYTFWALVDKNLSDMYYVLPVVLTGIYIVPSEVAFFKLALGYINLALGLIGPVGILLNVEFPKLKVTNGKMLKSNFIKISLYSLLLSLIITAGAIAVSPWFFRILYGESFIASLPHVKNLFVYGGLMGIGIGLGAMWRAIDRVRISIRINVAVLAAGIPLGLWLIKNYGLGGSVAMVTFWFTISHFISFFYLLHYLKKLPAGLAKDDIQSA